MRCKAAFPGWTFTSKLFPSVGSPTAVPKLHVPVRAVRAVREVPDIYPGRAPKIFYFTATPAGLEYPEITAAAPAPVVLAPAPDAARALTATRPKLAEPEITGAAPASPVATPAPDAACFVTATQPKTEQPRSGQPIASAFVCGLSVLQVVLPPACAQVLMAGADVVAAVSAAVDVARHGTGAQAALSSIAPGA